MRISTLAILMTLSGALALAGDARTVTYVAGNLTGLTPSSGATLQVASKSLSLRTGSNSVEIPFSSISKAELNGSISKPNNEPLYKVWALHKRLSGVNEMQQVMLDYKESNGEARSLTLEMQRATATDVMAAIDDAQAKEKAAKVEWWGDKYWKTKRNPEVAKP